METPRLIFFATVALQGLVLVTLGAVTFVLELIDVMTMVYAVVALGILAAPVHVYAITRMNG